MLIGCITYVSMKINEQYTITSNNDEIYLVNIVNGDVYHINDVVQDILLSCSIEKTIDSLIDYIYTKYESYNSPYGKSDLESFIQSLIRKKIIEI